MATKLVYKKSTEIKAPVAVVWNALTDPAQIKEYMFGTNTESDWKRGSTITYSGVWQGKPYRDKGTIIEIVPQKILHTTYFSALSGKEDNPENYANVIYEIEPQNGHTLFTLTQDNIADEAQLKHMEENWGLVIDGLKKLVEK